MTDSYNRYTVQRDTAGHAWLKGRAGGSVRIDAVVAIFTLHNCELWATVTGGRDVLLDDAADHDHGVGDMLEKHQQQWSQPFFPCQIERFMKHWSRYRTADMR